MFLEMGFYLLGTPNTAENPGLGSKERDSNQWEYLVPIFDFEMGCHKSRCLPQDSCGDYCFLLNSGQIRS